MNPAIEIYKQKAERTYSMWGSAWVGLGMGGKESQEVELELDLEALASGVYQKKKEN